MKFLVNPVVKEVRKFVKENLDGVWLDAELSLTYEPHQCNSIAVNCQNQAIDLDNY